MGSVAFNCCWWLVGVVISMEQRIRVCYKWNVSRYIYLVGMYLDI